MKYLSLLIIVLLSSSLWAQNIIVVEKPGTVNNMVFQAGDYISIRTTEGLKISGPINIIRRDSSFIIDFVHELKIKDIDRVYKTRAMMNLGGTALIGGSALYFGLDLINSGSIEINQSFWVGMGVAATGVLLKVFSKKKMRLEKGKWRIKILLE